MISAWRRIANQPPPVTLLLVRSGPVYAAANSRNVPFGHTLRFSRMLVVHSGLGDVIKKGTVTRFVGGKKKSH